MKIGLSIALIIFVIHNSHAEQEIFVTCPELKGTKFATFSNWLSKKKAYAGTKFYFGVQKGFRKEELLEINNSSLSDLENAVFQIENIFDRSLKTVVIIHGYRSSGKKPWVLEMKEKILKNERANIIVVDWSDGSYSWNYINSVRTTTKVSRDLARLIFDLRDRYISKARGILGLWNHFYFIGHSLGAHIAGQTGHILTSESSMFRIERITGLDPARPCFSTAHLDTKLDKSDADFVDIMHTQTSQGDKTFGFGLREPTGHLDLYYNGGVQQPACKSDAVLIGEFDDMLCSHRMAIKYFLESMYNTKQCPFEGHKWDQTYSNAMTIFEHMKKNEHCINGSCNNIVKVEKKFANRVKNSGSFLVFTSAEAPYCTLKKGDLKEVGNKLELLKEPKEDKTLFSILFDTAKCLVNLLLSLGFLTRQIGRNNPDTTPPQKFD